MSFDRTDSTEEPAGQNHHAFEELIVPDSILADQRSLLGPWDTNHFDQHSRRSSSSSSTGSSGSSSSSSSSGSSSSSSSSGSSTGSSSSSSSRGSDSEDSTINGRSTHINNIESRRQPSPISVSVSNSNYIQEDLSTDDEYDHNNDYLNDMVVSINDAFNDASNDASNDDNPSNVNNSSRDWYTTTTTITESISDTNSAKGEEDAGQERQEDRQQQREEKEEEEEEEEEEVNYLIDRRQRESYIDDEGNFRVAAPALNEYNEEGLTKDDMERAFFLEEDYQDLSIDWEEREANRRRAEADAAIIDEPIQVESTETSDITNTTSFVGLVHLPSGPTVQNGETTTGEGQSISFGEMSDNTSIGG
ncbi:hypothetical protein BCR43DRAFT_486658 [Syncephalastrum racemosum]|uniref:Uncharacterized protein n=1 Tax=Syncephalastrum racemosum TaxID=13706 RepID=A0A1X2HPL4_SYNRA|nr:hypothetical protein BCR43DRAFT_486658 [Syncephalastrum racemosum]